MVRHADTEMIVRKEKSYAHRSLETGGVTPRRATWGQTRIRQKARRKKAEHGPETLLGFPQEGVGQTG